ncbi:MAG TPA: hypothetical protein VGK20_00525 [Candidatus Binatia bacterium]
MIGQRSARIGQPGARIAHSSARIARPGARIARAAAGAALVACVVGCGLRTPPRPPEDTAPVIPGKVEATRQDGAVVVRWQRAEHSADGQKLDDLAAFVVERKRDSESEWTRIGTVSVIDQEKIRRRKQFEYRDESARDAPVSYRVIAVDADKQEGAPTAPAAAVVPPPKPPAPVAPAAPAAPPASGGAPAVPAAPTAPVAPAPPAPAAP